MSRTIRLTAAQAILRWLSGQMTEEGERFIEGVWAIFGNGNVAGVGEALRGIGDALPTWRGQNEQTMAHAAIAYAKTRCRRRAHAVTAPAKDANKLPSDAQVIGAVQRAATENPVAMCAAGTMPGALQVLGRRPGAATHMEYGYSCMGYEIAGALGIALAEPTKEVIC